MTEWRKCGSVCVDPTGAGEQSGKADATPVVDWTGVDGNAVRLHGATDVVGVFMGCDGARYVFRRLRDGYCHVLVLRYYATSEFR